MTPWVTRLLVANVAMYLLSAVVPDLVSTLMLIPALVLTRPWTLVTYMFLHGGLWHLLFNMLGLYFFGPRLEQEIGGRDFLILYFVSGLTGALLSFITPFAAIVGASGAVYGVLMGFARYWPRESLYVWGIIPIEARWLVVIIAGLSLFGGFTGSTDGIAHFAHLGGFAGGYLCLLVRDRTTRGARYQAGLVPGNPTASDLDRWSRIEKNGMHEVNRAELERIQAKIQTGGATDLSPAERSFLDRFSRQ